MLKTAALKTAVLLVLLGLAAAPASARSIPAPVSGAATLVEPVAEAKGRVFLLRGLLNVFSLGMDTLGKKIRAKGMPAQVMNFTHWRNYANVIVSQYRTDKSIEPVVIIGHSLGADSAVDMANYLGQNGVPVRLLVTFDGVHPGHKVGRGIAEVINYYKSDGVGKTITAGPRFTGKLTNVDVADRKGIDHLNIEKSAALHAEVIARLSAIFGN